MSETPAPFSRPPPSRAPYLVAAAVVVLGLGGFLAWRLLQKPAPPPAAPAAPATPAGPAAPAPGATPAPDASAVPALLQAISAHPLYRACLSGDEPARRWAQLTEGLSEGVVPAKLLSCAKPEGAFQVERRGRKLYPSAQSYARYDRFAEAVASVDAKALARAYQALHPLVEGAYRALGYPQGSLDQATARLLARVLRTPVPRGEVEVVEAGGTMFAYADQKLEVLGDVEKQLLRMGPKNTAAVQAKAREVSEALGISPAAGKK
ncbi:MAG: DUF3014 domain-containing protein [Deltaproteobacteria bacterium]|nr:DUF3014 domain-containing protein [Deltaproteobacteria bacterium]